MCTKVGMSFVRRGPRALVALLAAALAAAGCGASGDPIAEDEDEIRGRATALAADDFTSDLSKGFIEGTHAISPSAFDAKWKTARADTPVKFLRAFPAAYHKDFAANLRPRGLAKIPAGSGVCFGDAHPDNFGFLRFDDVTLYAYNDLDDSGRCRVAVDALRFVTAVRLTFDRSMVEAATKRYVKVLSGETSEADARDDVARLLGEHAPRFESRREEKLGELTTGDALVLGDGVVPVGAATRTAVEGAVTGALPGTRVLDVAEVERDGGGSAGLARYWALVTRGSSRTVLELKETTTPGVDHGLDALPTTGATRLTSLEKALWGVTPKRDYLPVKTLGKSFLLRDRMAMAPLDLGDLKGKELERVVEAQAGMIALLHKPALAIASNGDAKALRSWLEHSADTLARRWERAHD